MGQLGSLEQLTEEELERRARHEAGHVAMALVIGHRVRGATLDPPASDIDFAAPVNEGDIERSLEALAILTPGASSTATQSSRGSPGCWVTNPAMRVTPSRSR